MHADWIEILPTPLNVNRAIEFVSAPEAGGIDVFLGTTRSESAGDGRTLVALDYEAYQEMAMQQLSELSRIARQKFPIVKLAILHRVGQVAIAEASVVIAVSCPHRGQAFDACRFLIDELKAQVTIWKKEVWADGSTSWVDPTTR
ncbi:molybdenum cofactor biosynthesis protein MoaE [soil metagenome]